MPAGFPVDDFPQEISMPGAIPRELLRAECEPFFEQMITALQQGLQTQVYPGNKLAEIVQTMTHATSNSFQPVLQSKSCPFTEGKPVLDDESTEADEPSAFAGLFSGLCSEGESTDGMEPRSPEGEHSQDFEQISEPDKSIMVCRHWKSKGWCRLGSNCKFLHPEHKRGIAAPKAANRSGADGGSISGTVCPSMSATVGESDSLTQRRKRGGRNRSNRNQQVPLYNSEQYVAAAQTHGLSGEHLPFAFACTAIV